MSIRPEDVVLKRADGSQLLLELAHAGIDEEGYEHWSVLTEVDFQAGDHVEVGNIPQMCCIEFPLHGWKEVV